MPQLVREIAALLASGRSGPLLWEALAAVLAAEEASVQDQGAPAPPGRPDSGGPRTARTVGLANANLSLVFSAERASRLGLPVPGAIRAACLQVADLSETRQGHQARGQPLTPRQLGMWREVAACFEVCEASGAPVAAVLTRLATKLEAENDAQLLRDTALAGPRATVRLLSVLPFVGLGLGVLMGVDPLRVLLGSTVGRLCLGLGLALVILGRWWSASMIAAAAGKRKGTGRRSRANRAGGGGVP